MNSALVMLQLGIRHLSHHANLVIKLDYGVISMIYRTIAMNIMEEKLMNKLLLEKER